MLDEYPEDLRDFVEDTLAKIKMTEKRAFERPTYGVFYMPEETARKLSGGAMFKIRDIKHHLRDHFKATYLSVVFFNKVKTLAGRDDLIIFFRYV